MKIEVTIKKAFKGGWEYQEGKKAISSRRFESGRWLIRFEDGSSSGVQSDLVNDIEYFVLRPDFWKALGKSLGWQDGYKKTFTVKAQKVFRVRGGSFDMPEHKRTITIKPRSLV